MVRSDLVGIACISKAGGEDVGFLFGFLGGGGRYKYLKDFRSGNEGLLEPLPVDLPSCPSLATHDKDSACPVSEPSCSIYCRIAPKGASGSPWFKSHLCYEVSR